MVIPSGNRLDNCDAARIKQGGIILPRFFPSSENLEIYLENQNGLSIERGDC